MRARWATHGAIKLRWDRTEKGLAVKLTVPSGTTAKFVWGNTKTVLSAGTHAFVAVR